MTGWRKTWHEQRALLVYGFFVFLFIAGIVQYALGLRYILPLMPLMLSLLAAASIYFWDAPVRARLYATSAVLIVGYVVELIGIHTGLLFGNYNYGTIMGYKLADVPVLIGVTWLLVTLSAWQITALRPLRLRWRFVLGGVLVVMLDLVLEQFATAYGLWTWQNGDIPLYNYICWFVVGSVCFSIYQWFMPRMKPSLFIVGLLPLMGGFFWFMLLFT